MMHGKLPPSEKMRINNRNKTIALMHGKSSPSEHVLVKIKSNNSLYFEEDFEREILSFFLSKYHFVVLIHVYSNKKDKN